MGSDSIYHNETEKKYELSQNDNNSYYKKSTNTTENNEIFGRGPNGNESVVTQKQNCFSNLFRKQHLEEQQGQEMNREDIGHKRKIVAIDCDEVENSEDDDGKQPEKKKKTPNREDQPKKGDIGTMPAMSRARMGQKCIIQGGNDDKKRVDDKKSSYPFDGLWEMSWKSYPADPTAFVVRKHRFKMFGYMCKVKLGGVVDNYCPTFQWPVQITSVKTPIVQKGKHAIPPGTNSEEWPTTIEWTCTDPTYGDVTWTKLDSVTMNHSDPGKRKSRYPSFTAIEKRKKLEKFGMESTIAGKAWKLVERAIALQTEGINIIAQDDIMFLAERLLNTQKDYSRQNIPTHVDIAYHHTSSENLSTIQTNGLLSHGERMQQNIVSKFNGSVYGDGIYCSSDPTWHAKRRYGDTTILLARMKGFPGLDTLVYPSGGFCVLKCSNQCVPLFRFPSNLVRCHDEACEGEHDENFLQRLSVFHKKVQILLDNIFNNNVSTVVENAWTPTPFSRLINRWTDHTKQVDQQLQSMWIKSAQLQQQSYTQGSNQQNNSSSESCVGPSGFARGTGSNDGLGGLLADGWQSNNIPNQQASSSANPEQKVAVQSNVVYPPSYPSSNNSNTLINNNVSTVVQNAWPPTPFSRLINRWTDQPKQVEQQLQSMRINSVPLQQQAYTQGLNQQNNSSSVSCVGPTGVARGAGSNDGLGGRLAGGWQSNNLPKQQASSSANIRPAIGNVQEKITQNREQRVAVQSNVYPPSYPSSNNSNTLINNNVSTVVQNAWPPTPLQVEHQLQSMRIKSVMLQQQAYTQGLNQQNNSSSEGCVGPAGVARGAGSNDGLGGLLAGGWQSNNVPKQQVSSSANIRPAIGYVPKKITENLEQKVAVQSNVYVPPDPSSNDSNQLITVFGRQLKSFPTVGPSGWPGP